MKKSHWLLSILLLSYVSVTNALIAPLSPEALQENASQVVVGKVISVEPREEAKPYGLDTIYTVSMEVDSNEKGETSPNSNITFTYWKSKKRPKGFVGNFGQTHIIKPNMIIRAYLNKTPEGELILLEPNGWEKIQ